MSVQAMTWVLEEAPIPLELPKGWPSPGALTLVLLGLANHAGRDGRAAFPSVGTLSRYARLNERTVRRCLRALEDLGLIEQGNQKIAAAYVERADQRPTVYNLPVERGGVPSPRAATGGRPVPNGGASRPERGGETPPEPSLEPSTKPKEGSPEVPDSLVDAAQPAPPRCDAHDGMADAPPCRACARVREQREATERDHRARAAERHRQERERATEVRSAAIAECDLCDTNGYAGLEVCTHDPLLSVTRDRGLTAMYAAMGWDRKGPDAEELPG